MSKRRTYKDETKAAVMAALLAGQSISEVADEYKIPRGTVAGWSSKLNDAGVSSVSNTKKEEVGYLLVQYVEATVRTLTKQVQVVGDEEWVAQQSAAEMATLMGVLTDKVMKMFEAFGEAQE